MTTSHSNQSVRFGQSIAILGGGIVGLSSAFQLQKKGFQVHVIDPGIAKQRASYGNAGVLATCEALPLGTLATLLATPTMLRSPTGPLRLPRSYLLHILPWLTRFVWSSRPSRVRSASQALADLLQHAVSAHIELARETNTASLIAEHGWLKAYESEANYRANAQERQTLQDLGIPMQDLGASDIADLCPAAQGFFRHAVLYTGCQQVRNPGRYVALIEQACRDAGVQFHHTVAAGFGFKNGRPTEVHTTAGNAIQADAFVIAAGAWSRQLVRQLGSDLPLETEGGYHLMLAPQQATAFRVPTFWSEKSLVLSPLETGLRITGLSELAGLQAPECYDTILRGLAEVKKAMPTIDDTVLSQWRGFRPSMPDSLPVIGTSHHFPNCHYAFGHGHLGLTLGPLTGKLIANVIAGHPNNIDLTPYSPARYGT